MAADSGLSNGLLSAREAIKLVAARAIFYWARGLKDYKFSL
jgi:hypothetical protein